MSEQPPGAQDQPPRASGDADSTAPGDEESDTASRDETVPLQQDPTLSALPLLGPPVTAPTTFTDALTAPEGDDPASPYPDQPPSPPYPDQPQSSPYPESRPSPDDQAYPATPTQGPQLPYGGAPPYGQASPSSGIPPYGQVSPYPAYGQAPPYTPYGQAPPYPPYGEAPSSLYQTPQQNVSAIVLTIVSALLTVSCYFSLVGIVPLVIAIIALTKQGTDITGSRRLSRIGWIVLGVLALLFVAVAAALVIGLSVWPGTHSPY